MLQGSANWFRKGSVVLTVGSREQLALAIKTQVLILNIIKESLALSPAEVLGGPGQVWSGFLPSAAGWEQDPDLGVLSPQALHRPAPRWWHCLP